MRSLGFALVLALSNVVAAQPPTPPNAPVQGSMVAGVLAKVEANYRKSKHLVATFDQTVTRAIGGKPAVSTGSFRAEKPNKFRFEYLHPKRRDRKVKNVTLFDGKTLYVIDHSNLQYAQRAAASSELPSLLAFFLGTGTLTRDFKVALTADKTFVPAGATALELTPKAANATYARIILVLDASHRVARSIIINSSGDVQEMKFTSIELDTPAPADTFVFDRALIRGYKLLK